MHGFEGVTAVYYLPGPRPALIETGPASSLEHTLKGLEEAGADHLDWIVVTHIHLDHAGAVGHLAKKYPEARVVVRQEGAPHLADPSRLWASASRIYPDMEKLWGGMDPVSEDRIDAVSNDGPVADLGGGRSLDAVYSPGHANHHMALLDAQRGDLYPGDALGVFLPEANVMRPATPPPEFSLEMTIESVEKLRSVGATRVLPTHFGPVPDPAGCFDEAIRRYTQWVEAAEGPLAEGKSIQEIAEVFKEKRFEWYPDLGADVIEKFEQTTSYDMNAMGIVRYLKQRGATAG